MVIWPICSDLYFINHYYHLSSIMLELVHDHIRFPQLSAYKKFNALLCLAVTRSVNALYLVRSVNPNRRCRLYNGKGLIIILWRSISLEKHLISVSCWLAYAEWPLA